MDGYVSQLAARVRKKFEAGVSDLRSEALEGAAIVEAAAGRARDRADSADYANLPRDSSGANSAIYSMALLANWKC